MSKEDQKVITSIGIDGKPVEVVIIPGKNKPEGGKVEDQDLGTVVSTRHIPENPTKPKSK